MGRYDRLIPEERARVTEIQDLLIERYVERKEEIEKGNRDRIKEIDTEIKGLLQEREEIEEWANA
jgi:molybdenum-dependent DNA-binding transcriptional regulator ModE